MRDRRNSLILDGRLFLAVGFVFLIHRASLRHASGVLFVYPWQDLTLIRNTEGAS